MGSGTQKKCLHANTSSIWNKQEKLKYVTLAQIYDTIDICEIWRGESQDWSAGMEGY